MSLSPTYGRVSPAAIVDTMSLGTPIGRRLHRRRRERRAATAAEGEDPVEPPVGVEPVTTVPAPSASRPSPQTVAGRRQPGRARAGGGGDGDPRRHPRAVGLTHHAGVDDDHAQPSSSSRSRHVRELLPFVSSVPRRTTVLIGARRADPRRPPCGPT